MKIIRKFLLAFLLSVVLVVAIGITAYTELNEIDEEFDIIKEERINELKIVGDMKQSISKERVVLANYMAIGNPNVLNDIDVHHSEFEESLAEFKEIPGGIASRQDIEVDEIEGKIGRIRALESSIVETHTQILEHEELLLNDTLRLYDVHNEIDAVIYEMQQAALQSEANSADDRIVQNLSLRSSSLSEHINTYIITGSEQEKESYNRSIEDFKEILTAYRNVGGDPVLYARANAAIENLTITADDVFDHYGENVRLKALEEQMLQRSIKIGGDVDTIFDGFTFLVDERLDKAAIKMSVEVDGAISRIFYFTILMAILNITLGVLLSTSITNPINRLRRFAGDIGKGNLDVVVDIKSKDEISELGRSFEAMAKKLKRSYETLEQKVDERTNELRLLQKINYALNSGMDLNDILQMIVDGINSTFDYVGSEVFLLSDDRQHLILKNFETGSRKLKMIEKATSSKAKGYKIPLFEGSMFKRLIETKEPIVTDSIDYWEQWVDKKHLKPLAKEVAKIEGAKTRINVPLLAKGKVVGMIGASSEKLLTEEDKKRLMAFGEQVGLAIQKARLYEEWIKEQEFTEYAKKARELLKRKK